MGDIVGRLFREFAVTLAVTILVSAVVSLTLTPMMGAKLLKHTPESEQGRFYKKSEEFFEYVIAQYGRGVRWVLAPPDAYPAGHARRPSSSLSVLYIIVPKGFFPGAGYGRAARHHRGSADDQFPGHGGSAAGDGRIILKDPDVESVSSFIGIDAH